MFGKPKFVLISNVHVLYEVRLIPTKDAKLCPRGNIKSQSDITIIDIYNRLKSSNIRECVRIARLAKNESSQVKRIIDTLAKYGIKDLAPMSSSALTQ